MIAKKQLTVAQVLWTQYERKSLDVMAADKEASRQARLAFAAEVVGRKIASFSELTRYEAHRLINALKKALGLAITARSRRSSEDRGMQGRKGSPRHDVIAGQEDLDRISSALERLGWSQERFAKWLESPSSPLKATGATVRTQADANRVWWALKRMLRRGGLWKNEAA
jgi:hypothetical protein